MIAACVGAACSPAPEQTTTPADPWDEARRRGVEFRALGQEPGWFLEIDDGRSMRLVYDYMERTATTAAPTVTTEDARTVYSARAGGDVLEVMVERRPCQDAMSGLQFPATVIVRIGARELRGCGRRLP